MQSSTQSLAVPCGTYPGKAAIARMHRKLTLIRALAHTAVGHVVSVTFDVNFACAALHLLVHAGDSRKITPRALDDASARFLCVAASSSCRLSGAVWRI
eukprot:364401-Pleurochrysis_carterae.AAC.1